MKFQKIILCLFVIIASINLAYTQENVSTKIINGLITSTFETKQGDIIINLTADLYAKDVISGTISGNSIGKNENQKRKNKKILNGMVIEFGDEKSTVEDKNWKWKIPDVVKDGIMYLVLKDKKGNELARTTILVDEIPRTPLSPIKLAEATISEVGNLVCKIPEYLRTGSHESILWDFDGDFSTSGIKINDIELNILAESPGRIIFEVPENITGPVEIEVTENDISFTDTTRILDIAITVGKWTLTKGESTFVVVKGKGYKEIKKPISIKLTNLTPDKINMTGGDNQDILIQPDAISEDGTFEKEVRITAIKTGGFSVMVNIEPAESGFIKLISPIGEIYDSTASQPIAFEWTPIGNDIVTLAVTPEVSYNLKIWQLTEEMAEGITLSNAGILDMEPYFVKEGIKGTTFIYPHDFEVMLAARDRYEEEDEYFFCWQVEAQSGEREITESKFGIFQVKKGIDPHKKDTETKKLQSKTEPVKKGDEPNKKKPYEEFKKKLEVKKKQLGKTPIEKQDKLKKEIITLEGKYITSLGKNCRYEILDKIVQEKKKELIKKKRELELAKKNVKDAENELKKVEGELPDAQEKSKKAENLKIEIGKGLKILKEEIERLNKTGRTVSPDILKTFAEHSKAYAEAKKKYDEAKNNVESIKKRKTDTQEKKRENEQKIKQLEKEISALEKRISEIKKQADACRKMRKAREEARKKVEEAKKEKARKKEEARKKAEKKCKDGEEKIIKKEVKEFEFTDKNSKLKFKIIDPNKHVFKAARGLAEFWKTGLKIIDILEKITGVSDPTGGLVKLPGKIGVDILEALDGWDIPLRDFKVKVSIGPTKKIRATCIEKEVCIEGKWVKQKIYEEKQLKSGWVNIEHTIDRLNIFKTANKIDRKKVKKQALNFIKQETQDLVNNKKYYEDFKKTCK